jgi:3-phosphoshikimate 1-carboxyvinyltransferase
MGGMDLADQHPSVDQARTVSLTGPGVLGGTVSVPGDKSISHRALLLAGLAEGTSHVTGLSQGDDVRRTRLGLEQFGVEIEPSGDGLTITGGLWQEPGEPIDLGNSGTAMRLFTGVCAGQDAFTVLTGDQYLRARPMDRVAVPLRSMGATVDGRSGGRLAPLAIRGGRLTGIDYVPPVVSAQVKSAILLAGLFAHGPTTVRESVGTRRHTEEMLTDFGGEVRVEGTAVTVWPSALSAAKVVVPGDPSQAAFWAVGALICPDSAVTVSGVYLGFGRAGFVDVLRRMGASIEADITSGVLRAASGPLRGVTIGPEDIPGMVDEIPVIAVAAAFAEGTTVISGAGELRVKESDRIATTVAMLGAFGFSVTETADGMIINGGRPAGGATVDAHGDHRLAMAACICGLAAPGTTTIKGWDSVATSYPGFAAEVARLTHGSVTLAEAR